MSQQLVDTVAEGQVEAGLVRLEKEENGVDLPVIFCRCERKGLTRNLR